MPSSKSYLEFLLDQLPPETEYRAMMGEYVLYYRGRVFGGVYDDRLLVKALPASLTRMQKAPRELPYEGAKEMLLVEEVEDREFLRELLEAMYEELPEPKRKKR